MKRPTTVIKHIMGHDTSVQGRAPDPAESVGGRRAARERSMQSSQDKHRKT